MRVLSLAKNARVNALGSVLIEPAGPPRSGIVIVANSEGGSQQRPCAEKNF
jgi:hypothetical protein